MTENFALRHRSQIRKSNENVIDRSGDCDRRSPILHVRFGHIVQTDDSIKLKKKKNSFKKF